MKNRKMEKDRKTGDEKMGGTESVYNSCSELRTMETSGDTSGDMSSRTHRDDAGAQLLQVVPQQLDVFGAQGAGVHHKQFITELQVVPKPEVQQNQNSLYGSNEDTLKCPSGDALVPEFNRRN